MSKAWPVANLDPNAPLDVNARRILRVRIGEFYSYEPIVANPLATIDLHNLRIAAKRLRYTLELFAGVFGDEGKRQIDRVKAIQEALGTLHDLDVRIALISDELVELTRDNVAELDRALATSHPSSYPALTTAILRPLRTRPSAVSMDYSRVSMLTGKPPIANSRPSGTNTRWKACATISHGSPPPVSCSCN
jgi:hypothetical protein